MTKTNMDTETVIETTTKQGYKETKIGLIPNDWDVVSLGKSTSLITNGFVGKAKDFYSKEEDSVLYIQGYNVKENSFNFKGIKRVSKLFHEKNKKSSLKKNDLLTIQTGDIGLTAIVTKDLEGANCHALIISRFKEHFYPKFYSLYLNSHIGRAKLKRIETGSTMKHLNVKDMIKFLMPFPPLPEQTAIANCLSTWDNAIQTLTQLIALKEQLKKGLMQQLLTGKTRLNGFEGEWERKMMSELFTEIKKKNDGTGHEPLSISAGKGFVSQRNKFDRVIAGTSLTNYVQIKKGDFAYNKGNSKTYKMGCVYLLEDYEVALVPFVFISFRCKEIAVANFYKQFFINHGLDNPLMKIISSGARGDGLLNVNKKDFFKIKVPYPETSEQTAIAQVLQCADDELRLLTNKLTQLQAQKKGLMQQLLMGKKRLIQI